MGLNFCHLKCHMLVDLHLDLIWPFLYFPTLQVLLIDGGLSLSL